MLNKCECFTYIDYIDLRTPITPNEIKLSATELQLGVFRSLLITNV